MDIKIISELVAIILITCWVMKKAGLSSQYIPLLALMLGGVGAYLFSSADILSAVYGIFTGLATTLGYREIKETFADENIY